MGPRVPTSPSDQETKPGDVLQVGDLGALLFDDGLVIIRDPHRSCVILAGVASSCHVWAFGKPN